MKKINISHITSISLLFLLASCDKKSKESEQTPPKEVISSASKPKPVTTEPKAPAQIPIPPVPVASPVPLSPTLSKVVRDVINEWNGLVAEATGEELLQKQRDLAYQTVNRLGGGPELEMFLEFLKTKGAGDLRQEILDQGLNGIFTGDQAARSRQWILSIKDAKLKEQLMLKAGAAFEGADLVEYFQQVGASPNGHNNQCRLLTGYCSTLAKTDPEGALKKYGELAYPLRIDNTGFPAIIANFPPDADFLKVATTMLGDDTKQHGRTARMALLRNWTGVKPEEAAQYVLSNSKTPSVNPVQMELVMTTWAQKSPEAAQKWLSGIAPSITKDHGSIGLANFYLKTEPATAFTYATNVGDFDQRVKTSTSVFTEWAKTDKKAAEAAWVKAFPQ